MIAKDKVIALAKEKALDMGCFLVDVKVSMNNNITILFDNQEGVLLDDCLKMSRHIEGSLDREIEDYQLSVCSPGAFNPFMVEQQYQKNIGKEILVKLINGKKVSGILKKYEKILLLEKRIQKKGNKKQHVELLEIEKTQIKETKRTINFK